MTKKKRVQATCHSDRVAHAKGLCRKCHYAEWKARPGNIEKSRQNALSYYHRNRPAILARIKGRWAAKAVDERVRFAKTKALRQRYRLTPEEYAQMIIDQGGKCAICVKPFRTIDVDHDHETGHVRGLLCRACNLGVEFYVKFRSEADQYLTAALNKHQRKAG